MFKQRKKINFAIMIFLPLLAISLGSCATTRNLMSFSPPQKTHYTLRLGETKINQSPLPNQVPIFVDWHYTNGETRPYLGFRGWDFDRDERIDLLEVLNEDGTTQLYLYDFNGDGEVDMAKNLVH